MTPEFRRTKALYSVLKKEMRREVDAPDFAEGEIILIPGSVWTFEGKWEITPLGGDRVFIRKLEETVVV